MNSSNRFASDDDLEEVSFGDENFKNSYAKSDSNNSWILILILIIVCFAGFFYFVGKSTNPTSQLSIPVPIAHPQENVENPNSVRTPDFTLEALWR